MNSKHNQYHALFIILLFILFLSSCSDSTKGEEKTSSLPEDFNHIVYWENNVEVQEECPSMDSLCIEEHWIDIGESNNLSYEFINTSSSSSYSSSSSVEFSSSSSLISNARTCLYDASVKSLHCAEQAYKTTIIGTQVWMTENLNYETTSGSYCYGDDLDNCDTYGRLYTWATAMDGAASNSTSPSGVQGVCPTGWHLPSDDEWETMASFVANDVGLIDKSYDDWTQMGLTLKSSYGFGGGYAGYRFGRNYWGIRKYDHWWSSTESNSSEAYYRGLSIDSDYFTRGDADKSNANSVRCLLNTP